MTSRLPKPDDQEFTDKYELADQRAAEFVAGALPPSEASRFEDRLEEDPFLRQAFQAYQRVCESLIDEIDSVEPDARLKSVLLDRIDTVKGPVVRRADEDGWRQIGIPGVYVRVLYVDHEQDRMTALFRLEPGTEFPSHPHEQDEECFMIEGQLDFGDYLLKAGDYLRAAAGSTHGVAKTSTGCLCLITSALPAWLAA